MDKLEQYHALSQIRPDNQKLVPVYALTKSRVHIGPEVTLVTAPPPKKLAKARSKAAAAKKKDGGDAAPRTEYITVVYV